MEQSRHQAEEEQRRQADDVREALVGWGGVGAGERRARGGKERRPDDAIIDAAAQNHTHTHGARCARWLDHRRMAQAAADVRVRVLRRRRSPADPFVVWYAPSPPWQRREKMEKAKELERIKEELTGREDFLMKQSKQSKNKQKIAVRLAERPWPPLPCLNALQSLPLPVALALLHIQPSRWRSPALSRVLCVDIRARVCGGGGGMHVMTGHG